MAHAAATRETGTSRCSLLGAVHGAGLQVQQQQPPSGPYQPHACSAGGKPKPEPVEQVNKNPDRSIKNQIRGVERLLRKPDLPAPARATQDAKLLALHKSLEEHQHSEKERKFSIMYKKVLHSLMFQGSDQQKAFAEHCLIARLPYDRQVSQSGNFPQDSCFNIRWIK